MKYPRCLAHFQPIKKTAIPRRGNSCGSACGPVIVPVFKTGGRQVPCRRWVRPPLASANQIQRELLFSTWYPIRNLAFAPAWSTVVKIGSPAGNVIERPSDAVAVWVRLNGGKSDLDFLPTHGEVVQVSVVRSLREPRRGPLTTSLLRVLRRVAHRLGSILGKRRVLCHGARLILRGEIVSHRRSIGVEPPLSPTELVFQVDLVLPAAQGAVVSEPCAQNPVAVGLHECRARQVVATGVVVTVRSPVNEQRSFLDAVQRRVDLPTRLGGLRFASVGADLPQLRKREDFRRGHGRVPEVVPIREASIVLVWGVGEGVHVSSRGRGGSPVSRSK